MKTYTVIGYDLPDGGHCVETIDADNPTEAAVEAGKRRTLTKEEWEIVAVVEGELQFCQVDHTAVNLAPYAS
jgi:hypothetical protein